MNPEALRKSAQVHHQTCCRFDSEFEQLAQAVLKPTGEQMVGQKK